jgi:hypothetical protein
MELPMRFTLTMILFIQGWLFAAQTDFDVAIVGTSPALMLDAIYHIYRNEKVLILEADERCGGAWKSIDICGISDADLGCHSIGSDHKLKEFFAKYFGCKFTCLEHSNKEAVAEHAHCPNGYYFSQGCYELISKLKSAIDARENGLLLNRRLESIYIDSERGYVELWLGDVRYTTAKLIIANGSDFRVQNPNFTQAESRKHNYYHLYFLIEDPTPSRFTYLNGIVSGMTRAMNLTPFLKMPREGFQLIAIQIDGKNELGDRDKFLDAFKDKGLLAPDARITAWEAYVHEQAYSNARPLVQLGGQLIELLDTSSFSALSRYLEKWKEAIPLQEVRN